jgi:hypothetical protein
VDEDGSGKTWLASPQANGSLLLAESSNYMMDFPASHV